MGGPAVAVLLVGTLDTKGYEIAFVRDLLVKAGVSVQVLDAGVLGEPAFTPDVPRERLFSASGSLLAELQRAKDRGQAIEAAARGAARIVVELHERGEVDGILGLG